MPPLHINYQHVCAKDSPSSHHQRGGFSPQQKQNEKEDILICSQINLDLSVFISHWASRELLCRAPNLAL